MRALPRISEAEARYDRVVESLTAAYQRHLDHGDLSDTSLSFSVDWGAPKLHKGQHARVYGLIATPTFCGSSGFNSYRAYVDRVRLWLQDRRRTRGGTRL